MVLVRSVARGRRVPESDDVYIRDVIVQKYRLIYRFDENASVLMVMGLIHGSGVFHS